MAAERHQRFRSWGPEPYDALVALLRRRDAQEVVHHLHVTRDYMSHRDRREYWDDGRIAPVRAGLSLPRELNTAFGGYFLVATPAAARGAPPTDPAV